MQLLDSAATFIQEHGLSGFTMEALANEAGVSNPLIYKYFDTRLDLLQELLSREYARYTREMREKLDNANNFEEIVTIFVTANYEEGRKGSILHILRNQPDIKVAIEKEESKQRVQTGKFLNEKLSESYPVTQLQAEQILVMGSGASQAAGARFGSSRKNKEALIADTVRFILAGFDHLIYPK